MNIPIPPEMLRYLLEAEDDFLPPGSISITKQVSLKILERLTCEEPNELDTPSIRILERELDSATVIQTNQNLSAVTE